MWIKEDLEREGEKIMNIDIKSWTVFFGLHNHVKQFQ